MSRADRRQRRALERAVSKGARREGAPRILAVGMHLPAHLLPWERELLVAHLQELLESVLANPESDEEE